MLLPAFQGLPGPKGWTAPNRPRNCGVHGQGTGEVLCQVDGLAMTPLLQGSVAVRDIPPCLLGLGMTEQNQLHGLR
jgi:hypothetical protein